ncbi:probable proton-coupled zinc antiporter SLC30A3 [Serinus canaria]|uniref:probable proton-coupled zinc antiporter SLC30A3 n=1 Tax=Serinus canaria TaxID=9135 RepID=UPI0021CCA650|nr:probable proton-coupled zinc antiporter SLC30A3 [Serinus canaria]
MEPPTGTESSRLVSPRGGRADGSLRLKRYRRHRHPSPRHPIPGTHRPGIPTTASTTPSPAPPAPTALPLPAPLHSDHHRHFHQHRHTTVPTTPLPALAPPSPAPPYPRASPDRPPLAPSPRHRHVHPAAGTSAQAEPAPPCAGLAPPSGVRPAPIGAQTSPTHTGTIHPSPAHTGTVHPLAPIPVGCTSPLPHCCPTHRDLGPRRPFPTPHVSAPLARPAAWPRAQHLAPTRTFPRAPAPVPSTVPAGAPRHGLLLLPPIPWLLVPLGGFRRCPTDCLAAHQRSAAGPSGGPGRSPQAGVAGSDPRPQLQARRQLSVACAVCCLFMVGEVIGGYLAHSLAIMTDAAHLLTDVGSMSVSLFSLWVSNRPPTKTMTFGWHRSETLGALASVLSIWVVTAALVYLAAARIISNDYEIEARAMLATSACAVGVNLVMAYILHQSPAGHGHGTGAYEQLESSVSCQPSHSPLPGSTSVRAAFVHVVGDLLQSVSVLVAATIIYFKPQCKIADPISTLFFSVFVLGSTITILRDVFRVLMEGAPRGLEFDAVKEALLGARGVRGVHDLHLWALTLSHAAVSAHVAVDAGADAEMVLQEVTARLQRFGFALCTVQVEQHQEESAGCPHCQDPRT